MSEKLYNFLSEQGDYTKSYEDFQTQFANQDSIQNLHNFMSEKGDYTKSLDDFNTQFFAESSDPPKSWKEVGKNILFGSDQKESFTPVLGGVDFRKGFDNITTFFDEVLKPEEEKGLEEIKETDREQPLYFARKALLEKKWGSILGNDSWAIDGLAEMQSVLMRESKGGSAQGLTTQPSWEVMSNGKKASDETIQAFHELNMKTQGIEQTDAVKKYQNRYNELEKKYGGIMAFTIAVVEEPEYIRNVSVNSLSNMATTAVTSEAAAKRMSIAGGGGAITGSRIPGIGTALGFMSSAMGALSGTMDAGQSYAQFMREQMEKDGKDFTPENIKAFLNDDEVITHEDPNGMTFLNITGTRAEVVKKRSIRRGTAIGLIDGFTGVLGGGIAKGSILKTPKLTTRTTRGVKGTAAAVSGGIASEIGGQTAGSQEYDWGEILTEGIAEKGIALTGATVLPQVLKGKGTYKIGNQEMSEAEFVKQVNEMDDITLAKANVKVENDSFLENEVNSRMNDAYYDSQIDSSIKDPADRKELIKKQKELNEAKKDAAKEGSEAVPGAKNKVETIEKEISDIIGKYEGAVDIGQTETAKEVKKERIKIFLEKTEKFAEVSSEQLDFDPYEAFDNNDDYIAAYVDRVLSGELSDMTDKELKAYVDSGQIEKRANELADKANNSDGVNVIRGADGRTKIMINREIAGEYGAMNVGSHEVLHGVMEGALNQMKPEERKKLIKEFKDQIKTNLGQNVVDLIEGRLSAKDGYNMSKEEMATTSEWFTALSDIVQDERNNITYEGNKGFWNNIKDNIAFGIFREKTPYKKLSIDTGEQAFNFMKEYSKSVKEGKLSESMVAFAKGKKAPVTEDKSDFSKSGKEISDDAKRISKTIDDIGKKATTKSEYDAGVNLEAYDYLIDKKGLDGLIMAQLMKNNIDVKAKDANVNGVPLVDYMEDVRTKLIPDVLGFNPEMEVTEEGKFGLSGYINQRLIFRMGTVATKAKKTVTGRSLEQPVGTTGKTISDIIESDVDETTKAFEEEDISPAARRKKREQIKIAEKSKAIREHGVTAQDIENIKNDVAEGLTDPNLPRIDEFEWTQAFRDKVANKKSPLFKKIQKLVGTGDKFAQTLKNTRKVMFGKEGLPSSDLVQMEKMEKEKIFAELDYRATNQELIDQAVEKGLIKTFEAKTEKQGPAIYNRKYPTEKELLNFFGEYVTKTVKGKKVKVYVPNRGRRESYIINASNFFAQDAIADVLENKPKVYDTLVKNNAEKGLPSSKNPISTIKQRIDRDMNVMFSKSFGNANVNDKIIFSDNIHTFNKNLIKYNFNVRRAFEETYPERLFVEGKSKKLRNEIIQDLEKYIGWYKRQEGTEVKPELTLQDYIELELSSPELTVKDLRQAYGLSKKDIDFSNLDQIVSARVALLKIMQHPKMGKTRVIRFMKNLTEPTQLGNTDAIALSTEQVSTVDQVKETGKLQKKIDRKKKQINELKAKIKEKKAKKQSTTKEEATLLNAKKKLKEYQSPGYKRRPALVAVISRQGSCSIKTLLINYQIMLLLLEIETLEEQGIK